MKNGHKNSIKILITFLIVILGIFQISFLNFFNWGFSVFLLLTLFLIINDNIYGALFSAWFGGLLIDSVHFSAFGVSSLILLFLAAFWIILQKKALITFKTGGILISGLAAVFFYHFFEWLINIALISKQEKFYFYFLNSGFTAELLLTAVLLSAVVYFKNNPSLNA